jgi:uncharacterized membrane protein YtjA (UPF0391 family)
MSKHIEPHCAILKDTYMLHYAVALSTVALIAVLFDFGGFATTAVIAAAVVSLIFLILTIANLLFRSINKAYPKSPRLAHFLRVLGMSPRPYFRSNLTFKNTRLSTHVGPTHPQK